MGNTEVQERLLKAVRITPSQHALDRAEQAITDCLAVALAGSAEPAAIAARRAAELVDGGGDSPIWGTGHRVALGSSTFANAAAAHSLGWDDYTQPMYGHCSVVLLPLCAALATQTHASGMELLEAYLAGYEVNGRLAEVLGSDHYDRGWQASTTIGAVGAAAAAARMLDLDDDQTWNALGLGASTAAGFQGNFGSTAKPIQAGHAARAGLTAGILAQHGATANPDWLLSDTGYLAMMGEPDRDQATSRLLADRDSRLVIEQSRGLILKPYCCCASAHPMIRAIIEVVEAHDVDPHDITEIEVHVDPAVLTLLRHDRPTTSQQARYSLPYLAAVAAVERQAGPEQFTDLSIARDDLTDFMARIRYVADLQSPAEARYRAEVVVHTRAESHAHSADVPEGHPDSPMSSATLQRKFLQGATTVLPSEQAEELLAAITELRNLTAWVDLADLLSTGVSTR